MNVSFNNTYLKELQAYYALPWYKRLFKKLPDGPKS